MKSEIGPVTGNGLIVKGIHYSTGKPVAIKLKDGLIESIKEIAADEDDDSGLIIAPGLIDNQVNGYWGVDFSGEGLTKERLRIAVKSIWSDGVTTFIPAIVTASKQKTLRILRTLSELTDDDYLMDCIPGFHLEGPYLSDEEGFYGCHPRRFLRRPAVREFEEYQAAANGKIREITIAPELDGAIEFIKKCHESGLVIAIGHTNATAGQIELAAENGATLSTHIGNGCSNMIHRHLNPLWAQLASDGLAASVIADGHHLLPEELRVIYKCKGESRIILISDATHFIGMEPGSYDFMGNRVIVDANGLVMIPELNCLAGASLPLKKGIETLMKCCGCALDKALDMACLNPARLLNLNDRGTLGPGKRADFILFEFRDSGLKIRKTFIKGEMVFQAK